jgi:hypothetical protein
MFRALLLSGIVCCVAGCGATTFHGAAHIVDGPAGCQKTCSEWNEEFVGMVAMGEYSDACICHERGKQVSQADSAGVAGAAAGVMMQMGRARAQAANTQVPMR